MTGVETRPTRLLVTGLMALAFLVLSAAALRPWIALRAGHGAPLHQAARRALSIEPGNDRFQTILATIYQFDLLLRDHLLALTYYHSTLRSNPLDSASWLHLSELYRTLDRPREADGALRLAVRLAPSNAAIAWGATTAFLGAGQLPDALHMLTRFITMANEDDSAKAYDLARILVPPDEVLDRVIPATGTQRARYLRYLLNRNRGEGALRVWSRLRTMPFAPHERIDIQLPLQLVDLLLSEQKMAPAHDVWNQTMEEIHPGATPGDANLISNGGFEDGLTIGRGFDWKIEGAPGIECDFDSSMALAGRRSLRISFGKGHADFSNVSQLIHVQPKSIYALAAFIRTSGFDGSSGIGFEVIDPLKGLLARTEPVTGTRDWTKVGVTFRVPENSRSATLRVRLRQAPSSTQPGGATAWIDSVSLTRAH